LQTNRRGETKGCGGTTTTEDHNRQPSFDQQPRIHKITAKVKRPPSAETGVEPPRAESFPNFFFH
jgi:hypothetical protein